MSCWCVRVAPCARQALLTQRALWQVVLKVLGQHAEPEHLAYLLSLAPRKKLGSLNLEELIALLETVDVKLALPLQTIEKLKEVRPNCISPGTTVLMRVRWHVGFLQLRRGRRRCTHGS